MPHTRNCGKLAVTMATTITWHNSVLQLQTVYLGLVLDAKKKTNRLTVGIRWLLPETRSDLDWNTLPELRFNRCLLGPNQFTKLNRTWRHAFGLCPRDGDQNIGSRWAGRSTNEICSRCGVQNQKATPTYSQGVDRYTKHTQPLICSFFPPRGSDWGQFVSLFAFTFIFSGDH